MGAWSSRRRYDRQAVAAGVLEGPIISVNSRRGGNAWLIRVKRTAVQFAVSRMVTVNNQKPFQRVRGALDSLPRCPSKVRRAPPSARSELPLSTLVAITDACWG